MTSHINGAQPSDPVQDAIKSVEHYLFRGTNTMACCLCLIDGGSVIALTSGQEGESPDLGALQARSRAEAEQLVAEHLNSPKEPTDGSRAH